MNRRPPTRRAVTQLQLTEELKKALREVVWKGSAVLGFPRQNHWPDVFVLMPFTADLEPVYKNHIRKVAARLHLEIDRADHFFGSTSVIQDIWSAIHAARIIIADCTGTNPNVFYEIGLAHAIGKHPILITQSDDNIPFNIGYLRVIPYKYTPEGMKVFEKCLLETIAKSI